MNRRPFEKVKFAVTGLITFDKEVSDYFDDAGQPMSLAAMDDAQLVSEIVGRIRVPDFTAMVPIEHPYAKVFLQVDAEHNHSGYVATDLTVVINSVAYSEVDEDWLEDPLWAAAMHEIWRRVIEGDTTPLEGSAFVEKLRYRVDYLVEQMTKAGVLKEPA